MSFDTFTGKAKFYAEARPSYPNEAVEYIMNLVPKNAVFADIGAGTGKFSELISQKGYTLFAVEPNEDMRNQLILTLAPYGNATIVNGSSSDTTLYNNSIDVITCAQALHWFDPISYMEECKRIGKSTFLIVVVYNDHSTPDKKSHREIAVERFLDNYEVKAFPNNLVYTRELWLTYMTSHSSDPAYGSEEYPTHIAKMNEIFNGKQKDGLMYVEETTKVFTKLISL